LQPIKAYVAKPGVETLTVAATALATVANKGVTAQTVTDLNAVLGVSVTDPQVATQIAEKAQALQAEGTSAR
jgi:hypothetical protein